MTTIEVAVPNSSLARFWAKVNKTANCWEWLGCKDYLGRGQLTVKRRKYRAHRFSWIIHNGAIPNKLCVCHTCDNPSCVNPDHLFLGTQQDNMDDMIRKGRAKHPTVWSKDNHPQAKITMDDARDIRWLRTFSLSCNKLAIIYGLSKKAILNIVHNVTWRED